MTVGKSAMTVSPVINGPFKEPDRHLAVGPELEQEIEGGYDILPGRRTAGIVETKGQGDMHELPWRRVYDRIERIRQQIKPWRENDYPGASHESVELLTHWASKMAFFCQLEAIETRIWLEEVAPYIPEGIRIIKELEEANGILNRGLDRYATKMATGTGKTRAMAMLMVWMASRKINPVSDFLIITPNRAVTNRLQELKQGRADNIYKVAGLYSPNLPKPAIRATVTHWQQFVPQSENRLIVGDKPPNKITKKVLEKVLNKLGGNLQDTASGGDQRIRKMAHDLDIYPGFKLHVINDEGHHCYLGRRTSRTGDKEAKIWFEIIQAIEKQGWLHGVSDFSATPIYPEGTRPKELKNDLFPWVVSDFPLLEAVECGLTKTPRIPEGISKESEEARNVFLAQAKLGSTSLVDGIVPFVEWYLRMIMYHHLKITPRNYGIKKGDTEKLVICIVAGNIDDATALFRYIAGDPEDDRKPRWYELSNLDKDGKVKEHPPTLLVHSRITKTGEIEGTDTSLLLKFFGRPEDGRASKKRLSERIDEMFMTAGKKNKPGKHIRCIVSVDKLTEGWDCQKVTEIFGYRAFGSDLLCEQVTGRALRRTDYTIENKADARYKPQVANLIGVPFSWMPTGKDHWEVVPPPLVYECYPLKKNIARRITVPNLIGYRFRRGSVGVTYNASNARDCKIKVELGPDSITVSFIGHQPEIMKLPDDGAVASKDRFIWLVADEARRKYEAEQNKDCSSRMLMAGFVIAVREWLFDPRNKTANLEWAFEMPKIIEAVAEEVHHCCKVVPHEPNVVPVFPPQSLAPPQLDSGAPLFETSLENKYPEIDEDRRPKTVLKLSERNIAPCHSQPELHIAMLLEEKLSDVEAWARNLIPGSLGLEIPYRNPRNGRWHRYQPDFVARTHKGNHVVIEYKGDFPEKDVDQEESKRKYAEDYWIPAVNGSNEPQCRGNWVYCYVEDQAGAENQIAGALREADGKPDEILK